MHLTIDSNDDLTFEEREAVEAIMSHVYQIVRLCFFGTIMVVGKTDSDAEAE